MNAIISGKQEQSNNAISFNSVENFAITAASSIRINVSKYYSWYIDNLYYLLFNMTHRNVKLLFPVTSVVAFDDDTTNFYIPTTASGSPRTKILTMYYSSSNDIVTVSSDSGSLQNIIDSIEVGTLQ